MTADAAAILLARHEQLPPRAAAAARVLLLVEDPRTAGSDLARAVGADPVLAARVLRVANSSYYGLSGRVSTLPFAVSVVGFQAVRSLAVVAAAGLDDPRGAPPGFWRAASLAATAAEALAPLTAADTGDAFCVGLLHGIGAALLHQHQALDRICLPEVDDVHELLRGEQDRYGISHDQIGGRALAAWHLPQRLCDLIATHHEPIGADASPLARTLAGARLVPDELLPGVDVDTEEFRGRLGRFVGGVPDDLDGLLGQISERSGALLDGLAPRS